MVNHPNRGKLSALAEELLRTVLAAGGSRAWWPDNPESHALRALERRGLIFCDDEAMRQRPTNTYSGLIYTLTEDGKLAAALVARKG